jgi:hypothetical protein
MMKKNEEVEEFTEDVVDLQHVKVALLVCASGVTSAAFRIAAARHVLTLLAMQKLESESFAAALCSKYLFLWAGYAYRKLEMLNFLIGHHQCDEFIIFHCSHFTGS